MAIQMNFTSGDGVEHAECYWNPGLLNLSVIEKRGAIIFHGYHNIAARQSNKAVVGQKIYSITPTQYDQFFSVAVLQDNDPLKQCYALAMSTLDTDGKSFFDGGANV